MTKTQEITATTKASASRGVTKHEIDFIKFMMYAIVVVLFLGFTGMFIATGQIIMGALQDARTSNAELNNQIRDQNEKIESLIQRVEQQSRATKN